MPQAPIFQRGELLINAGNIAWKISAYVKSQAWLVGR